ncbi:Tol-Pal system protein TolB [Vibrio stylophorae]|uniref:Tol-Pal system protein TolB n=1 Tax=Vibrio stylophorae TaxID=659351 RepID=A0ABM8ZSW1_9VIBR|nr:Tol-Pal system beta propeller repeat protein TolB [Vibrio stylophorae]CAH0533004.1 Tol-Pal system protein TolB [Vibrio stylophorae]
MLKHWLKPWVLLISMFALQAHAELEIVITKGVDSARPIAVVPFQFEGTKPMTQDIAKIVAMDLQRSGYFSPVATSNLPRTPYPDQYINFSEWTDRGIDAIVTGKITQQADGNYTVHYQLIDAVRGKNTGGQTTEVAADGTTTTVRDHVLLNNIVRDLPNKQARTYAHRISDLVFEELTGIRGAFRTHIAYVVVDDRARYPYQLRVADYDGYNERLVVQSREPIMSPAWSPDGRKLAYVSFENRRSQLFIQDLYSGKRELVSSFPRHNGSPQFSPDGSKLAMVLSKSGSLQIYILDLKTKKLTQVTHGRANNTEAFWDPDGKSLIFTSDRGGQPQIYQVNLADGQTRRLTWEGSQNQGGQITPDGQYMVMVNRNAGGFNLAKQSLDESSGTSAVQILTKTLLDESPSIAPNGTMIIYSSVYGKNNVLSLVSIDGRFKARLPATNGRVRAPAWSPFL